MPLTFADFGGENIIKRIGGSPEVKKHQKGPPRGDSGSGFQCLIRNFNKRVY